MDMYYTRSFVLWTKFIHNNNIFEMHPNNVIPLLDLNDLGDARRLQ